MKSNINIVHINSSDWGGGAAIAAHRLNDAMNLAGFNSKMLVLNKRTKDSTVKFHQIGQLNRLFLYLLDILFSKFIRFHASWSWNKIGCDFSKEKVLRDADIIYIHWVNNYCLSNKSIEKILKLGKPVFWYMHDMWPITGGCHYSLDCIRYKEHCHNCEMANRGKGSRKYRDLSYWQFEEKLNRFSGFTNLSFITPSKWLADKVKESRLFKNNRIYVRPNLLDVTKFKPVDKETARKDFGLPLNKKLLLFGADNINSPYKGWNYLKEALDLGLEGVECVIYGKVDDNALKDIQIKIHNIGHIKDTNKLIKLYSACDIFVTPSLADNYPNVLVEAMACGLPCVGFNVGGIPEIIKDGISGKIVKNISGVELHEAIMKLINHHELASYSSNAINQIKTINNYDNVVHLHSFN